MIEFIRELNRNYLSIVHEDEREPDYTMKMVENNSISGLLSLRKSVVNNRTSYLYDISGCIPLEEKYIKNEFTVEDILLAADSIKEIIYTMDKYMLDINGVLFDVAYIFCGINDDSWKYVYNSEMSSDAREGIKEYSSICLEGLTIRMAMPLFSDMVFTKGYAGMKYHCNGCLTILKNLVYTMSIM